MTPKPIHPAFTWLAVALVLAGVYFGTYAATVEPSYFFSGIALKGKPRSLPPKYPAFSFLDRSAEAFFRPAHELDRMIRPAKWEDSPSRDMDF